MLLKKAGDVVHLVLLPWLSLIPWTVYAEAGVGAVACHSKTIDCSVSSE
jgi:hypothetical protein